MAEQTAAHLRVLAYLQGFAGKPAPHNRQIFNAVGVPVGSSYKTFQKLEDRGFLRIERTKMQRRFVFLDGSSTDWGSNAANCKEHKVPLKPRRSRSDETAKMAIERYWRDQGVAVNVVIEGSGVLRTYHPDGTPLKFGVPEETA